MKRIILCADDYGQNSAISQAIVDLIRANRLTATSQMVTMPQWESAAAELAELKPNIDIGLHFNLTEGILLSKQHPNSIPLKHLILRASLRQLSREHIETELHLQLDKFESVFHRSPDYLDGHQHAHQLPVIRDVVLDVYEKRLRQAGTYIRSTANRKTVWRLQTPAYLKQLIIQLCGGIRFQQLLKTHNIPHNTTFTGVYDFREANRFPELFSQFLDQVDDGGIIMCHPGLTSNEQDAIYTARPEEYAFLKSQDFSTILSHKNIQLTRFNALNN